MEDYEALLDPGRSPAVIVTTHDGRRRSGCLVTYTSPCSMVPPLYGVWLSTLNLTHEVAARAPALAVHFLTEANLPLAELFGGSSGYDRDKFAAAEVTDGPDGIPLLAGTAGHLVGRITARLGTGDHTLHVLDPFEVHATPGTGRRLTFDDVRHIEPGRLPAQ